jgi:hypothetical protein
LVWLCRRAPYGERLPSVIERKSIFAIGNFFCSCRIMYATASIFWRVRSLIYQASGIGSEQLGKVTAA